jgi:hypothetical protein
MNDHGNPVDNWENLNPGERIVLCNGADGPDHDDVDVTVAVVMDGNSAWFDSGQGSAEYWSKNWTAYRPRVRR